MLNKESEEHEQSKQEQEIKEQEILNCLWSESQELYISYRNDHLNYRIMRNIIKLKVI